MKHNRWQSTVMTTLLSGGLGVVYSWTVLTTDVAMWWLWFGYAAVLGVVCGTFATLLARSLMLFGFEKPSLMVTLILGAGVGLVVALVARQDLLLCAMLGEVGALLAAGDIAAVQPPKRK